MKEILFILETTIKPFNHAILQTPGAIEGKRAKAYYYQYPEPEKLSD
jgi:hypothetical protein